MEHGMRAHQAAVPPIRYRLVFDLFFHLVRVFRIFRTIEMEMLGPGESFKSENLRPRSFCFSFFLFPVCSLKWFESEFSWKIPFKWHGNDCELSPPHNPRLLFMDFPRRYPPNPIQEQQKSTRKRALFDSFRSTRVLMDMCGHYLTENIAFGVATSMMKCWRTLIWIVHFRSLRFRAFSLIFN